MIRGVFVNRIRRSFERRELFHPPKKPPILFYQTAFLLVLDTKPFELCLSGFFRTPLFFVFFFLSLLFFWSLPSARETACAFILGPRACLKACKGYPEVPISIKFWSDRSDRCIEICLQCLWRFVHFNPLAGADGFVQRNISQPPFLRIPTRSPPFLASR